MAAEEPPYGLPSAARREARRCHPTDSPTGRRGGDSNWRADQLRDGYEGDLERTSALATTRLAETISTWWPQIEAFLRLRITNARTECSNQVIKQLKRVGCGHPNQDNYERRIVLHVAAKNAA